MHYEIQIQKVVGMYLKNFSKNFLKCFMRMKFFFQCRLTLEKASCIISYLYLDIIDALFGYLNTPFFRIKSHVL